MNQITKGKLKDVSILFIAWICFIIFLKMCQVTLDSNVEREPLREIDNWK